MSSIIMAWNYVTIEGLIHYTCEHSQILIIHLIVIIESIFSLNIYIFFLKVIDKISEIFLKN